MIIDKDENMKLEIGQKAADQKATVKIQYVKTQLANNRFTKYTQPKGIWPN